MSLGRSAVIVCVISLAAGVAAAAQDLPNPETIRLDLGRYLHRGKRVMISGESLRRVGGRVIDLAPDTIILSDMASGTRTIPLSSVDTLWTRTNPTLLGFGLGLCAGATIGGALCVFGSQEKCGALAIGTASGALLGTVIGKLKTVWTRRYARRDGGPVPVIQPMR
jgi:hypothetical protein